MDLEHRSVTTDSRPNLHSAPGHIQKVLAASPWAAYIFLFTQNICKLLTLIWMTYSRGFLFYLTLIFSTPHKHINKKRSFISVNAYFVVFQEHQIFPIKLQFTRYKKNGYFIEAAAAPQNASRLRHICIQNGTCS